MDNRTPSEIDDQLRLWFALELCAHTEFPDDFIRFSNQVRMQLDNPFLRHFVGNPQLKGLVPTHSDFEIVKTSHTESTLPGADHGSYQLGLFCEQIPQLKVLFQAVMKMAKTIRARNENNNDIDYMIMFAKYVQYNEDEHGNIRRVILMAVGKKDPSVYQNIHNESTCSMADLEYEMRDPKTKPRNLAPYAVESLVNHSRGALTVNQEREIKKKQKAANKKAREEGIKATKVAACQYRERNQIVKTTPGVQAPHIDFARGFVLNKDDAFLIVVNVSDVDIPATELTLASFFDSNGNTVHRPWVYAAGEEQPICFPTTHSPHLIPRQLKPGHWFVTLACCVHRAP